MRAHWAARAALCFAAILFIAPSTAAAESEAALTGAEAEAHQEPANAVLFLFTALAFGIIFRRALAGLFLPYSAALLIWGLIVGLLDQKVKWEHAGQGIALWESMPPELFLLTFLPILLYGSGSSLDWHTFFRNLPQIMTLAFPGVGLHMVLVAVIYKFAFPYDWSWTQSFLYGAIISATDPVAVVAIMKEVGASKRLGHLIEGESLLNDGSAFVFFLIFFEMYTGASSRSPGEEVGYFFKLVFVAAAIGAAFGILLTILLALVYRDMVVEITATVATAFLCFWVAEELAGVSGVLAVVALSIFIAAIGKYAISPDVTHAMHIFWDVLEFMANTVVFFYFGIIIAARIWDGHQSSTFEQGDEAASNLTESPVDRKLLEGKDYGYAVLNWVFLNLIRLAVIAAMQPLLNRHGDGFSWRDVLLATWAGLRGAVGLSLALIVDLESIERRAEQTPEEQLRAARYTTIVVFFTGTMSVLTIIIQGSSMPWVLSWLGLTKKTPVQIQHLLMAAKEVEEYADRNLGHLRNDYSLGEPDWGEVTADTALDLQELLPTKKELLQLIERFGGTEEDAKVADELWHSAQKEEAAKQQAGQHGDLQRSSLHRALDVDVMAMHRDEDSGPGEGSGKRGDAGKRMAQQLKEQDDSALAGMAAKKERKQESHQARRNEVYKSVHSADALLKMFQERRGSEITCKCILSDLRARYLHGLAAIIAEGFEKGFLNGEQHAAAHGVIATCLDHPENQISDFEALQKLVRTPIWLRAIVKTLSVLGRVVPPCERWSDQVLFLNLESDIGIVAAFVYAHDQASKGMIQLAKIIEDGLDGQDDPPKASLDELELVEQVIEEGKKSRERASQLLASFRRDYPVIVRAVKTRETSQTVLMHKSRFVKSLAKAGLLEEKESNVLEELIQQRLKKLYFRAPSISMPSATSIVRDHPLFSHFSSPDLCKVLEMGNTHVFDPNAELFKRGQNATKVYVILRGTISRRNESGGVVHVNGSGSAIGISEVIFRTERQTTVVAENTVETFNLSAKVFRAIVASNDEFRQRAYRHAAASVSMAMQWTFMRGMTYPELVNAFKTCDLLPTVEAGEEVDLEEHGILMDGSVTAWVEKPNLGLTRRGNVSKLQRASVAMRPPQHSQQQGDTPQGEHKTISAPALLKPGTYPVETSTTIIEVPRSFHRPVAQHHDHVRHLTLFRRNNQPGEQQPGQDFLSRASSARNGESEHEQGDFGFNFLSTLRKTSSNGRARASVDIGRTRSVDRRELMRSSVPINSYAGTSIQRRSQRPQGSVIRRQSSDASMVHNLSYQRSSLDGGGLPRTSAAPALQPVREQAQTTDLEGVEAATLTEQLSGRRND